MCTNLISSDDVFVSPCASDITITVTANVFDHPLLTVDAISPVTGIGTICCGTLVQNPTSDPAYVCRLHACAIQTNNFLAAHFSDYTGHISDRCHLSYNGPVSAGQVLIDLNDCNLIFRHFTIPCSDTISICGGN
jgi:hypothetical protein